MLSSLKRVSGIGQIVQAVRGVRLPLPHQPMEGLEERRLMAAPAIDDLWGTDDEIRFPGGKSIIVPIHGTDADGDKITYTFNKSDKRIKIKTHNGNPFIRMTVDVGPVGTPNLKTITLMLMKDMAPKTVDLITGLIKGENYDGSAFDRIVDLNDDPNNPIPNPNIPTAFILQGGKIPGLSRAPFEFEDELTADSLFTGKFQFAMAKTGTDDTNSIEWFLTETGQPRHLDYVHTVYGQVVDGFDVVKEMVGLGRSNVSIQKVELVRNISDTVITVSAPKNIDGKISVTATDSDGKTATRSFDVVTFSENRNLPPFIRPMKDLTTGVNQPIQIRIPAFDAEGDQIVFNAQLLDGQLGPRTQITPDGLLIIEPAANYRGPLTIQVAAGAAGSQSFDTETFVIAVGTKPINNAQAVKIRGIAGKKQTVTVATFKSIKGAKATDFGARINFGDGQVLDSINNATATDDVTITRNKKGIFSVKAPVAYRTEGAFNFTVDIYDTKTRSTASSAAGFREIGLSKTVRGAAVIADAKLNARAQKIFGTEEATDTLPGAIRDTLVATFKDTDPRGKLSDFSAVIEWGDGTTTTGTITGNITAGFQVRGTHAYANPGTYNVEVTIRDKGGSRDTVVSKAFVGRKTLIINGPADITQSTFPALNEGPFVSGQPQAFTRIGSFADSEFTQGHSYFMEVNWGDGTKSNSSVNDDGDTVPGEAGPNGDEDNDVILNNDNTFTLNHNYLDSGLYTIVITVKDVTNNTFAVDTVSVFVTNKAPTVTIGGGSDTTGVPGQTRKITFSATDVSEADSKAPFSFTVNWGDGASTTVPSGQLSAEHVYASEGTYSVTVTARDKDISPPGTSSTHTITISKAVLQPDPIIDGKMSLIVGGTQTDDTISISQREDGKIDVKFGTTSVNANGFAVTGRVQVFGRAGNDTITAANGIDHVIELYGEGGNDVLKGGDGNDILIGGAQNDKINGGAGNDLLIGGFGNDVLDGNFGEDILLGAGAKQENNSKSLNNILARWNGPGSYNQRVTLVKDFFNESTIIDDADTTTSTGGADILSGGQDGSDLDLYFAKTNTTRRDGIRNRSDFEPVVKI